MEKRLIEFVRKNSFLFDSRKKTYKNMKARKKKWIEIAKYLNVPVQKVKKRWATLRDRYVREQKEKIRRNGSGAHRKKPWRFTELMRFLDDIPRSNKKTIENIEHDTQNFEEKDMDNTTFPDLIPIKLESGEANIVPLQEPSIQSQSPTNETPPASNERQFLPDERNANIDDVHKEMTDVLQMVKQYFQGPSNSLDLFFTSAAIQVQEANLPVFSQAFIKSEVSRIIMDEIKKYVATT